MLGTILLVAFVLMASGFVMSLVFERNDVVDFFWGLTFISIAVASLVIGGVQHWTQYVITGLVIIWGSRLCIHIFLRLLQSGEDKRYAAWRKEWMAEAVGYFYVRSFLQIFMFQGLLATLVMAPVIVYNLAPDAVFSPMFIIGIAIWLFGFAFEVVADRQLTHYLRTRKQPRVMNDGLWEYSRHPNYFGEVVQWWGIWLAIVGVTTGWIGIIGPATITVLILYVSGIPLLEQSFQDNKTYDQYRSETSAFVPMRPFK